MSPTSARDEILARVRAATADVTAPVGDRGATPVVEVASPGAHETVELFAENVADYRAVVVRVPAAEVGAAVARALRDAGCRSVAVPDGLDAAWVAALTQGMPEATDATADGSHRLRVVRESDATTAQALDEIDGVVTASAVGVATTGTIVLDHGPDQGRRALTLVPDVHVCVVRADQVVHDVPEAVARLRPGASPRPLTWVSGPSATSDIELQRVEGVHGPRTLVVVVAE
ncbi:L-lactate dehydrogenase complex protein LldG [Terracoccus luteus]|uniref:L-lactate dehydrogenase complex protein LldG n=1 Tax=Terracoccus luteus TaxID=53356 RepID=A0A495Y3L0_9MICO|nr:LUD domain-containing protein [Terracoccus luteus]RKT80134.1 L-lactate dehydrogenase complex protein LldG [Terracoccus luteus]